MQSVQSLFVRPAASQVTNDFLVGDIIHLIGYYPPLNSNRPPTTTPKPLSVFNTNSNNQKPYYQPNNQFHYQNEWNTYESNHIGAIPSTSSSYPTYHAPGSSSVLSSNAGNNYNYNQNHNHHQTNVQHHHGGFMDDSGYSITPSAVVSNDRPQSPVRPSYNDHDYNDDFSYGSYQGIQVDSLTAPELHITDTHTHVDTLTFRSPASSLLFLFFFLNHLARILIHCFASFQLAANCTLVPIESLAATPAALRRIPGRRL